MSCDDGFMFGNTDCFAAVQCMVDDSDNPLAKWNVTDLNCKREYKIIYFTFSVLININFALPDVYYDSDIEI